MSQSKKRKNDFSDLAEHDAVAMVTNTAVVAKNSGHGVVVRHATIGGKRGILVFIPEYEMVDGVVRRVQAEPVSAGVNGGGNHETSNRQRTA